MSCSLCSTLTLLIPLTLPLHLTLIRFAYPLDDRRACRIIVFCTDHRQWYCHNLHNYHSRCTPHHNPPRAPLHAPDMHPPSAPPTVWMVSSCDSGTRYLAFSGLEGIDYIMGYLGGTGSSGVYGGYETWTLVRIAWLVRDRIKIRARIRVG